MVFVSFSSLFTALCSSSDVAFTLPLSFLVSLHVYMLGRHSFASLIDKQLSRNATLMSLDVLLSEFSSYFHLNQLRNFLAKTYRSGRKRIARSQRS